MIERNPKYNLQPTSNRHHNIIKVVMPFFSFVYIYKLCEPDNKGNSQYS